MEKALIEADPETPRSVLDDVANIARSHTGDGNNPPAFQIRGPANRKYPDPPMAILEY